jgi:hypothetical protein
MGTVGRRCGPGGASGAALVVVLTALAGCAPVPVRPAAPRPPGDELMALVPGPVQALLAIDLAQLRGSPWARPVLESASPEAGRQRRGFDEIGDVDRWLLANVRAPGSGTGTLELGRGRFDRPRVQASFLERFPSAQERRFGGAPGLADAEAAVTFPRAGTVALGPIWAVQAAVQAADPQGVSAAAPAGERWLAEARAVVDQARAVRPADDRPGPAVEVWLRLDESTRGELAAVLGNADALERVAARLDLAADARVLAVGFLRSPAEATSMAAQLNDQLAALGARRSLRALGLGPVLERARVAVQGNQVVVELAVSADERDTVSQRLAAVAAALRARPPAP